MVDGQDDLKKVSREHLELFGSSGLRTLCLAYKDLSPDVYESWNEKFIQAKSSLRDREKKLDEVCCVQSRLVLKKSHFLVLVWTVISSLVFFTLSCSSAFHYSSLHLFIFSFFFLSPCFSIFIKVYIGPMQVNFKFNEGGRTHRE